jgi:hypothetical protein
MTAFYVLAAAALASVGPQRAAADEAMNDAPVQLDLSGRWEGPSYFDLKGGQDCGAASGSCMLRLDVVACGEGWCGVELSKDDKCGGTALRLGKGKAEPDRATYEGKLELAKGTEPYVVRAFLASNAPGGKPSLEIIGDTGGEFRMFRRSFPFQTTLSRSGDPHCKPETTVSLAD